MSIIGSGYRHALRRPRGDPRCNNLGPIRWRCGDWMRALILRQSVVVPSMGAPGQAQSEGRLR
jgi:hypothetical protein